MGGSGATWPSKPGAHMRSRERRQLDTGPLTRRPSRDSRPTPSGIQLTTLIAHPLGQTLILHTTAALVADRPEVMIAETPTAVAPGPVTLPVIL